MTNPASTRRRFLRSTTLAGLGTMFGPVPAFAFTPQAMDPTTHQAWLDRCSNVADPYHQKLLAEARADLVAKGLDEAGITSALAALTCPVCGCPIATAAVP
jgi:hypothetical protein